MDQQNSLIVPPLNSTGPFEEGKTYSVCVVYDVDGSGNHLRMSKVQIVTVPKKPQLEITWNEIIMTTAYVEFTYKFTDFCNGGAMCFAIIPVSLAVDDIMGETLHNSLHKDCHDLTDDFHHVVPVNLNAHDGGHYTFYSAFQCSDRKYLGPTRNFNFDSTDGDGQGDGQGEGQGEEVEQGEEEGDEEANTHTSISIETSNPSSSGYTLSYTLKNCDSVAIIHTMVSENVAASPRDVVFGNSGLCKQDYDCRDDIVSHHVNCNLEGMKTYYLHTALESPMNPNGISLCDPLKFEIERNLKEEEFVDDVPVMGDNFDEYEGFVGNIWDHEYDSHDQTGVGNTESQFNERPHLKSESNSQDNNFQQTTTIIATTNDPSEIILNEIAPEVHSGQPSPYPGYDYLDPTRPLSPTAIFYGVFQCEQYNWLTCMNKYDTNDGDLCTWNFHDSKCDKASNIQGPILIRSDSNTAPPGAFFSPSMSNGFPPFSLSNGAPPLAAPESDYSGYPGGYPFQLNKSNEQEDIREEEVKREIKEKKAGMKLHAKEKKAEMKLHAKESQSYSNHKEIYYQPQISQEQMNFNAPKKYGLHDNPTRIGAPYSHLYDRFMPAHLDDDGDDPDDMGFFNKLYDTDEFDCDDDDDDDDGGCKRLMLGSKSGLLPNQMLNSKRKRKLPQLPLSLIKRTFEKHEEKIKKVGAFMGCLLVIVIVLGSLYLKHKPPAFIQRIRQKKRLLDFPDLGDDFSIHLDAFDEELCI